MSASTETSPARVSLPWRVTLATLHRLPQGALSRLFGWLADRPLPRFARPVVHGVFARLVGLDVGEAERPMSDYRTLNDFFVRKLREGIHQWSGESGTLASPVDGVVGAFGRIESGRLIQAKGLDYTAEELLGDEEEALDFEGGTFLTIYLSPRHYHRIHTPARGEVRAARHIPGRLFPVNGPSIHSVDGVFSRNERLICSLDADFGPLAVVAVGAYNVGRISAAFDPAWSGRDGGWITNRGTPPPPERRYPDPIVLEEGAELMAFHLGSTVVLLTAPGVDLVNGLHEGQEVRVGEILARRAEGTGTHE